MKLHIRVSTHWINGWFLRAFASPVIVVDGEEIPTKWGEISTVEVPQKSVTVGAGVRYSRSGKLGGYQPHTIEAPSAGEERNGGVITFRNGLWNHDPFIRLD